MNTTTLITDQWARYELRFKSLFDEGRAFAFPCDARGLVNLDALSERLRVNYFYARSLIGRDFHSPIVLLRAAAN